MAGGVGAKEVDNNRRGGGESTQSSLGPWGGGAFIEARSIATIGWYFESFFALGYLKCRRSKPTNGFDGGVKAPLTTSSFCTVSSLAGGRNAQAAAAAAVALSSCPFHWP